MLSLSNIAVGIIIIIIIIIIKIVYCCHYHFCFDFIVVVVLILQIWKSLPPLTETLIICLTSRECTIPQTQQTSLDSGLWKNFWMIFKLNLLSSWR